MKLQLLEVTTIPNQSFSVRREAIPNINSCWHCHREVELIHFHRGSGTQFVGDSIRRFKAGDVVLIGASLPHYWHYDQEDSTAASGAQQPYSTVIHFSEDFWGSQFLALPENKLLKSALELAKRGLMLTGAIGRQVAEQIDFIYHAEGTYRLMALMQCLLLANDCDESNRLSSLGFQYDVSETENERLNRIYRYTLARFSDKIRLDDVAALAGLVPNSFCRYFKHRTGKPYSRFLLEIRVGHACKLLIDNTLNIKQICFDSGFNNFTCFYKQFKAITGLSPMHYQRTHAKT